MNAEPRSFRHISILVYRGCVVAFNTTYSRAFRRFAHVPSYALNAWYLPSMTELDQSIGSEPLSKWLWGSG